MSKKEKKFDCVAMKREIQAQIYNETKDMGAEEFLAYCHEAVEKGPFAQKMKRIQTRQQKERKASVG